MTKATLYLILITAAFAVDPILVREAGILLMGVMIGTGAAVAFNSRTQKVSTGKIIASLMMGLFVGMIARELVVILKIEQYKVLTIILGAAIAEYVMIWFSKRYMKLFDGVSKKAGINTDDNDSTGNTEDSERSD